MLSTLQNITYQPLSSQRYFEASMNDYHCTIKNDVGEVLEVSCLSDNDLVTLTLKKDESVDNDDLLLIAIEYILGHNPELQEIKVCNLIGTKKEKFILQKYFVIENAEISFSRYEFFQLPALWHKNRDYIPAIEKWIVTNERVHPLRPDVQSGVLYKRYVPSLGKTLSFRVIDPAIDLDIFHEWHNLARVAKFWELPHPKEELLIYIEKSLSDPHTLPMIEECDGVPVGYFEMYWTREDRLAPYYTSEAFDRGFHFLIGNNEFLGFKNTDATLKSLSHFLFLDELRTRKIMAEPRSDNHKVLKYIETFTAWKKLYEFNFPHKRAALLECTREAFFMEKNL